MRGDNRVEERPVLHVEEEVRLVAGMLPVQLALFGIRQLVPRFEELELPQLVAASARKRLHEPKQFADRGIGLRPRRLHDGRRIAVAEIARGERTDRAQQLDLIKPGGVYGEDGEILCVQPSLRRLGEVERDHAVRIGTQIGDDRGRLRKEVQGALRRSAVYLLNTICGTAALCRPCGHRGDCPVPRRPVAQLDVLRPGLDGAPRIED